MDTVKFLEWLSTEKSMGARSAKDVVSRCGRVNRLLGVEELGIQHTRIWLFLIENE